MSQTSFRLVVALALVAAWGGVVLAADWPQWQGPNRDAVSTETGLLKTWPEGGPTLAWRIEGLGGGDSAPAIVDGRLYGMSTRDGQEIVWCLSEKDGSELWATSLGEGVEQRMPQSKEGPGGTPTVSGDHLYVIGMGGRVACLTGTYPLARPLCFVINLPPGKTPSPLIQDFVRYCMSYEGQQDSAERGDYPVSREMTIEAYAAVGITMPAKGTETKSETPAAPATANKKP